MTTTAIALRPPEVKDDWRKPVLVAYLVILAAFGGAAGWASVRAITSVR